MTLEDKQSTIAAMRRSGGEFDRRLAALWEQCDSANSAKLELAFADTLRRFAPGGILNDVGRLRRIIGGKA
ncbi:hypothetical protein UFOVP1040_3 [uncultured Caudovirales phage]|uniref:Uncharacterized protein n=1 Tax=uncultured Caudovirales phage TaxID=2100421 RepID=A0A6J5QK17_9CAUD|nr:hypothetical protein UFOVP1040_3 [uncultured Caudovirales phage]